MGWSFRIAQIRGIDIKVHISFFLILALGAFQWADSVPGDALNGALFGLVLIILLFFCVTLHELGHSLVAQRFGIPTREIVLFPLGGVALIEKNPKKPLHELIIAAAGPLVNVVIALALAVVAATTLGPSALRTEALFQSLQQPSLQTMLLWLLASNIGLVLFNLIPAFPLDGGRMLRAALAMRLNDERATQIASVTGQIIAVGLGLFAIVNGQFFLALIAGFIFLGAGSERQRAVAQTVLAAVPASAAYNKHALTLQVGDRISKAVDYMLTSYQSDFAVLQGSNIIGVLPRDLVLQTLALQAGDRYVTEIMQRDFLRVDANKSLDEVQQAMSEAGARLAAVFDGPQYLGLISADDIREAFTVSSFVKRQQKLRQQQMQHRTPMA
jgi:Zn-dependent protease/predicted transcriptional regulator